jgi:hypothetical protein
MDGRPLKLQDLEDAVVDKAVVHPRAEQDLKDIMVQLESV